MGGEGVPRLLSTVLSSLHINRLLPDDGAGFASSSSDTQSPALQCRHAWASSSLAALNTTTACGSFELPPVEWFLTEEEGGQDLGFVGGGCSAFWLLNLVFNLSLPAFILHDIIKWYFFPYECQCTLQLQDYHPLMVWHRLYQLAPREEPG